MNTNYLIVLLLTITLLSQHSQTLSLRVQAPSERVYDKKVTNSEQAKSLTSSLGWSQVNLNSSQSRLSAFSMRHVDISADLSSWKSYGIESSSLLLDPVGKQLIVLLQQGNTDETIPFPLRNTVMGSIDLTTPKKHTTISSIVLSSQLQPLDTDDLVLPVLDAFGNYFVVRKNVTNGKHVLLKIDSDSMDRTVHILFESDGIIDVMHGLLVVEGLLSSLIVLSTSKNIVALDASTRKIQWLIPSRQGYFGQLIHDHGSSFAFVSIYGGMLKFDIYTGVVISQSLTRDESLVPYQVSSLDNSILVLSHFRTIDGSLIFANLVNKSDPSALPKQPSVLMLQQPGECSNAISIANSNDQFIIMCRTSAYSDRKSAKFNQYTLMAWSAATPFNKVWELDLNEINDNLSTCSLQIVALNSDVSRVGVLCNSGLMVVDSMSGIPETVTNPLDQVQESTQVIAAQNGRVYFLRDTIPRIDSVSIL